MKRKCIGILLFFISVLTDVYAQKKLTVIANKPLTPVSRQMWGIFFEDINFAADGGLYAELVKNGSFEFPIPMMGWKETRQQATGKTLITHSYPDSSNNFRYAHISVDATSGSYGLSNEGFRGIGIHKGEQYNFSVTAAQTEGDVSLVIQLVNSSGQTIGTAGIDHLSSESKTYRASITASDTAQRGRLNILFRGKGIVDIDHVSLFPKKTWKERPRGLRNDLVQLLADLKPGFIRFPGGCIVEGRDLANRYEWKNTVGDPDARKLIMNRWNVEFPRKAAPDYYQSFGLGFFEYFQLAEDIGAEPLPIINCGMACQFNSGEVVSMNNLDPFVQDALDLIEFANGDITTTWGKLRNDMGHPAPFNLKLLGVGNEQWDEQYIERYKEFEKILKQKYPQIKLVAAAGPFPDGSRFEYAWTELRKLNADLIDEHYYQSPDWFFKNVNRYDNYDRKGPKVFAGEYAAHSKEEAEPESRNTWISALAEAAFMTGLERNAAVVQMCSYAPLFAHVDAWQWRPDLIWFDNLRGVGTPNYQVQKLFSNNKGTDVVAVLQNGEALAAKDSIYGSAVIDRQSKEVIIKLVNASTEMMPFEITIEGIKTLKKEARVQELFSTDLYSYNSLDQQKNIYPSERVINSKGKKITVDIKPRSVNVIKLSGEL